MRFGNITRVARSKFNKVTHTIVHTRRVPSANRKRVIKLRGYAHSCNALNFSRHRTNRSATRVHGKYWRTSAARQAFNSNVDFKRRKTQMDRGIMCTLGFILIQSECLKYWRKGLHLLQYNLSRLKESDYYKRKKEREKIWRKKEKSNV